MTDQKEFKVNWQADDGYVWRDRPQSFKIHAGELSGDETAEDLKAIFWSAIDSDFAEKIHATCSQEDEFVAWATEQIAAMREAESE